MKETMGNAFVPGSAHLSAEENEMITRRTRLLGPAYRLFYARPLQIVRGEGVWLYDPDGTAYLDAYNNVPSVGHCHPHVTAAITKQAATLNTHTRYLHPLILEYSERLLRTFPAALSQVMYTCTGSEANDLALRIANAHTGGTGVVVTRFAYHGTTSAIAEISPALGEGIKPGPHVEFVDAPDTYRERDREFPAAVARAFAALESRGIRPSALLVDTVFTSDGSFVDPPGFLAGALEACRNAGALFIADEVQPGFGRSGQMWGFSRHGIVPDLVTLGKPMGNGHPIAGVVVKPEILQRFADSVRYFNTFGGNPVSIAAANAVLDVLENEKLLENAARVGRHLLDGAKELQKKHEVIGDVRGEGFVFAIELVSDRNSRAPHPEMAALVVNEMRERRVLLSVSGPNKTILKIRPPLCFSAANADQLLETLDAVLNVAKA